MKIIKNLSIANIRKFEGFIRREDLDFIDDGDHFRGFSYKGMPITTLRADNTTYLSIRVDYLKNEFTYKEWAQTEESKLCDKFNGVSEFDINELVENIETILAKVDKMNKAVVKEEIDMSEAKIVLADEIKYVENVVENFKSNFKWYEADEYKLKRLVKYLKLEENEIKKAKEIDIDKMSRKQKKEIIERLTNYGYIKIDRYDFYIREMLNAITNC